MGEEGTRAGGEEREEVMIVEPAGEPSGMNVTFKELDKETRRRVYQEARPWLGRGTPPTREELVHWLKSMDEGELAANQEAIMAAEAEEAARWAAEDAAEEEERNSRKGESSGKKGKGKGKGKGGKRGSDAEERHVRRMEEGRSK